MPPRLIIEVVGDVSHLEKSFKRAQRSTQGFGRSIGQAGRGAAAASLSFRGLGRSIGLVSGAFLGGAGLVSVLKSSVSAASNLAEQQAKTNVVFGDAAKIVSRWSKTTVEAMGLAEDQALETASSFGALLRPLGLTGEEAAKQSTQLTKLGADLASFYNTSVADALQAVRSGLVGESEPLRRYGVLLTEARVASEAMAQSGKKNAKELTAQEKVLARQAIILKDAAQAQGDFARTSGGLANQQRILSANVRQLQIGIGQQLTPELLKIVKAMNEWLSRSQNQRRVTDAVREAVSTLKAVVQGLTPFVQAAAEATRRFADAVGGARNAIELLLALAVAAKFAKLVGGIAGIGAAAAGSRTQVNLLRGSLLGLARIGSVAVVIDLIVNKKSIDKQLEDAGLGFLTKGILPQARDLLTGGSRASADDWVWDGTGWRRRNRTVSSAASPDTRDPRGLGRRLARTASTTSAASQNFKIVSDAKTLGVNLGEASGKAFVDGWDGGIKKVAERAEALLVTLPKTLGLEGKTLSVAEVNRAMAAREQAAQFRALGLTATGEKRAPGAAGLLRLTEQLLGRSDTGKLENRLKVIRKVITGNFKAMSDDVRRTIRGMLDDIKSQLGDETAGPSGFRHVSPNKLARQLGLGTDRAGIRSAAAVLATIGAGGRAPAAGGMTVAIQNATFNGVTDINQLEGQLEKRARQRAVVRRGAR